MSRIFSLLLVGLTLLFGCSSDNDDMKTVSPAAEKKVKSEVQPNVNTEQMKELIDWLKNPEYTKKRQYFSSIGLGENCGASPYPETYVEDYDDKYNDEEYVKFGKNIIPELVKVLFCNPQDFIVRKICRVLYEIDATAAQRDLMEFCFNNETSNSHRLIVLEHFERVFEKKYDDKAMKALTVMFAFADADVRLQLSEMILKFKTKGVEEALVVQFNVEDSFEIKLALAETLYSLNPDRKNIVLPCIHEMLKNIKRLDYKIRGNLYRLISRIKDPKTLEILFELYDKGSIIMKELLLEPMSNYHGNQRVAIILCDELIRQSDRNISVYKDIGWLRNFNFECARDTVLSILKVKLHKEKMPMRVPYTTECLMTLRTIGDKETVTELVKLKGVNTDFNEDIDDAIESINERLANQ